MTGLFQMTMKEIDRYHVIKQVISKKIKQREAARELNLSTRQIRRLVKKVKANGAPGLKHGLRGKNSNNKLPEQLIEKVNELVSTTYEGFGPTLAAEKLEERDGLIISVSALRERMISTGEWKQKKQKPRHRKKRDRRSRFGELIQIDGSPHKWFEIRGEPCNLINFVDDASSDVAKSELVKSEDRKTLMRLTKEFIEEYGRPASIYVDRHSIYKVNRQATIEEELKDLQAETQYERAMRELNIKVIFAHTPQAKGRVERSFGVDQDRLVKEMRLESISNMEDGNKFLHEYYLPKRNKKFSVEPKNSTSAFRPLLPEHNLDTIFSCRTKRTIHNDYTVRYKNKWFQIAKNQKKRVFAKNKLEVEERLDDSIHLRYKGIYLKYKEIIKRPKKLSKAKVATRKYVNEMKILNHALDGTWRNSPEQASNNQQSEETKTEYIPTYRAVEVFKM